MMAKGETIPWPHLTIGRMERVEIDAQHVLIDVIHLGNDDPLVEEARAFWQASKSLHAAFCGRFNIKSQPFAVPCPPKTKPRRAPKKAAEDRP